MTPCPERDVLISLGNATGWELDRLEHVATCSHCRRRLDALLELRVAIDASSHLREGFTERVMASLSFPVSPKAPGRRRDAWAARMAAVGLPIAVALTSLAALHAGGGIPPERSALAALVTGLASAIRQFLVYRSSASW